MKEIVNPTNQITELKKALSETCIRANKIQYAVIEMGNVSTLTLGYGDGLECLAVWRPGNPSITV
jgi:hypothetical protein